MYWGVGTVPGLLAARWKGPGSIVGRGKIFPPTSRSALVPPGFISNVYKQNFLSPRPEGV